MKNSKPIRTTTAATAASVPAALLLLAGLALESGASRAAELEVRITEQGEPAAQAEIMALDLKSGRSVKGRTDAEGRGRFDGLAPGAWRIIASTPGAAAQAAQRITLRDGVVLPPLHIALQPQALAFSQPFVVVGLRQGKGREIASEVTLLPLPPEGDQPAADADAVAAAGDDSAEATTTAEADATHDEANADAASLADLTSTAAARDAAAAQGGKPANAAKRRVARKAPGDEGMRWVMTQPQGGGGAPLDRIGWTGEDARRFDLRLGTRGVPGGAKGASNGATTTTSKSKLGIDYGW